MLLHYRTVYEIYQIKELYLRRAACDIFYSFTSFNLHPNCFFFKLKYDIYLFHFYHLHLFIYQYKKYSKNEQNIKKRYKFSHFYVFKKVKGYIASRIKFFFLKLIWASLQMSFNNTWVGPQGNWLTMPTSSLMQIMW